ncbi:plasmid pRiA4b ORF-3 family protein [Dysgonomonas sp. 521]|uniref:plasmid pRiA4b ORF-3 family protein n=1 Tax=Dysgonomonas sp. 521 TaxID=2302932 RepID=UPI0013D2B372|nr:plasmid pRiA4b ORF-3 family protein [Dysgonomonas sp. 521]NDV96106.1 plasmid pRiA4b ORF-3 family protein [Dysgonomonas sp. 521]
MTIQFKIQIKGITKPPVWRKVAVPSGFTFLKFHQVIQTAFGWEDCHLFEFKDKEYQGRIRISIPADDDFFDSDFFADVMDSSRIKLSDVFTKGVSKLLYVYDFGDDWLHEITLESVVDDNTKKAVCLSGKGACPPEDCGGIYGYEDIKETFRTMPDSDQAEDLREWLGLDEGENWDATLFDIDEINAYLKQI